jgi:putative peptidoglycan lipid II flippase
MSISSIRQAGLTLIVFAAATKVLGLVKEMVLAANFGATQIVDVYLAGITFPAMVRTVITWALPDALVPLFSTEQRSERGTGTAAVALVMILSAVSGLLWFLAEPLAAVTGSGFSSVARAETVIILRITAASVVLSTIEALFQSRLLAQKRFVYSGMAGVWISVCMIVAIVAAPGGGARTLAWGYLAGILFAAVWNLLPFVFPRRREPGDGQGEIREKPYPSAGRWIVIVILLSSAGQLYTLLDRYLASFLAEGSMAVLNFATLVASQPVGIFGLALGMAVLPFLPRKLAEHDLPAAENILNRAIRWVLIGSVPMAVWTGMLAEEIISLLFERGAFDASARAVTGQLLVPYSLWLVPAIMNLVLVRMSYAMFRWRPILCAELGGLTVKAVLSFWLVGEYGAFGLVVATVIASISIMGVLLFALPHALARRNWAAWVRLLLLLSIVSLIGTVSAYYLPAIIPLSGWREIAIMRIATAVLLTTIMLIGLGPRLRIEEIGDLRNWLIGRIRRR